MLLKHRFKTSNVRNNPIKWQYKRVLKTSNFFMYQHPGGRGRLFMVLGQGQGCSVYRAAIWFIIQFLEPTASWNYNVLEGKLTVSNKFLSEEDSSLIILRCLSGLFHPSLNLKSCHPLTEHREASMLGCHLWSEWSLNSSPFQQYQCSQRDEAGHVYQQYYHPTTFSHFTIYSSSYVRKKFQNQL